MRSNMGVLIKKEWQENLVNLIAGVIFMIVLRVMVEYLDTERIDPAYIPWNVFAGISMIFCSVFLLITAIGMFAMEYNHKTMNYLFTKPVDRKEILTAKALIALSEMIIMMIVFLLLSTTNLKPAMNKGLLGMNTQQVIYTLLMYLVILPCLFYCLGVICSIWFKNMTQATMSAIVAGLVVMAVIMQFDIVSSMKPLITAGAITFILIVGSCWLFINPNRSSS